MAERERERGKRGPKRDRSSERTLDDIQRGGRGEKRLKENGWKSERKWNIDR